MRIFASDWLFTELSSADRSKNQHPGSVDAKIQDLRGCESSFCCFLLRKNTLGLIVGVMKMFFHPLDHDTSENERKACHPSLFICIQISKMLMFSRKDEMKAMV